MSWSEKRVKFSFLFFGSRTLDFLQEYKRVKSYGEVKTSPDDQRAIQRYQTAIEELMVKIYQFVEQVK